MYIYYVKPKSGAPLCFRRYLLISENTLIEVVKKKEENFSPFWESNQTLAPEESTMTTSPRSLDVR